MLRHDTYVRCMLCEIVPAFYLANVATDTAAVHSKQNNRRKFAFDKYNAATTSMEPYF